MVSPNWPWATPKVVFWGVGVPVVVGGLVIVNLWSKPSPVAQDYISKQVPKIVEVQKPYPVQDPASSRRIAELEQELEGRKARVLELRAGMEQAQGEAAALGRQIKDLEEQARLLRWKLESQGKDASTIDQARQAAVKRANSLEADVNSLRTNLQACAAGRSVR